MYNNEIRDRFVEHRARGISLDKVTSLLGISRTTAVDWNRRFKTRIADLRALHYEAALERAGADYQQEVYLAMAQLNRVRAVLAQRKVEYLSTEYLFNLEAVAFARMEKLMRLAELPDSTPAAVFDPSEPEADAPGDSRNVDTSGVDTPAPTPQSVPDLNHSAPGGNGKPTCFRPVSAPKRGEEVRKFRVVAEHGSPGLSSLTVRKIRPKTSHLPAKNQSLINEAYATTLALRIASSNSKLDGGASSANPPYRVQASPAYRTFTGSLPVPSELCQSCAILRRCRGGSQGPCQLTPLARRRPRSPQCSFASSQNFPRSRPQPRYPPTHKTRCRP